MRRARTTPSNQSQIGEHTRNFIIKRSVILGLIDWRNFYGLFYGRVKFCCKNRRPADPPIAPCEFRRSINRKTIGTAWFSPIYWAKPGSAYISVVLLVSADCPARLRSENAVNGSAVITGTGESAL